ncbi:AI-2E family transporter [Kordiimonas sp. SCSIO 12610]|uniref:AI-2E family transporter n=1 Tax=Kordiimonas sp. SCSIO 12610 TaxID=2829597 RepID=UPI00210A60AD|nr:AI-2E family transporter [Kordiimonas sp. SCSIO 12610]UTW55377.1 AI-2E family transporter [Kordiimonas sp. SCSIO 12610]
MNMISAWFNKTFADTQVVLLILVVALAVIGLTLFGSMLAPAIAAIVIAFLLDGPIEWLKSKGVRSSLAFISVFLGFILLSVITLLAVVPPLVNQITQFINEAPNMVVRLQNELLALQQRFPDLISETQVQEWLNGLGNEIANLGPRLLEYSLSGVTGAVTFIIYTVLVPMMVFFFLKDKDALLNWAANFLPSDKPLLEQVWRETLQRAGDYARGKVYEIVIVGLSAFIAYQIIDLPYATLLAVATGLSVIIPYIGAAAVTIPVALVSYAQWGIGSEMAIAVGVYLVLQALDGNVLVPLLFSEVVNLHPNAIIIAVLVFGGLWGFWGVFFAIPLATVANAIIRAWQQRRLAPDTSITS